MKLHDAIDAAIPTSQGDRFAIAEPWPDVSFVAAYWKHNDEIRVRGHRFDEHRNIVEAWDVEDLNRITIDFRPLAR